MRAVRMVLWAEARHRWRSWLALVLLVALAGGVVMAGVTAGRRVATAFPRFVQAYGVDNVVYALKPIRGLDSLPQVSSADLVHGFGTGVPRCACPPINPSYFGVEQAPPTVEHRLFKLVSGRLPDPSSATDALISFSLAQQTGLQVGSEITVPFYARSQMAAATGASNAPPGGPDVTFHVVGIEAAEYEFPSLGTPTWDVWATPAFERAYQERTFSFHVYYVRLRHGAADQQAFEAAAVKRGALGFEDEDVAAAAVVTSLHPQAVGWWILAALVALAGLLAVAQAFGRQTRVASETYPTLSAIGLEERQLVWLNLGRALAIGAGGALGGVVLAVVLSPLTPMGEARVADPSSGLYVDPVVVGLAVVTVMVVTVLASLWPALRSAQLRSTRGAVPRASSGIVNRLAAAGAPPTAVVGVRRALERGQGRDAVPVGTALIGTVLAVLALSATAVFGSSLSHLISTPTLYGQPFDVTFNGGGGAQSGVSLTALTPLLTHLRHDPSIAAVTEGAAAEVKVGGVAVDAIAGTPVRGPMLLSTVSGRVPARDGEVALGSTTLRQVGGHVGSVVEVTVPAPQGGTRTAPFRVVGTVTFPGNFGINALGNGAVFTIGGLAAAQCGTGPGSACVRTTARDETQVLLVTGVPGPAGRATVERYARAYASLASFPLPPVNLVNFGQAVNFPLIIGVVLALFGAATLLHTLLVSTTRRRTETGLLKALGFQRGQIAGAVSWQATTIAVVGVVVGIPLGIAVGEAVWRLFADNLGVLPQPVVTGWVAAALALGVVVLANVLAIGPAIVSARLKPAELLRTQ